MKSPLPHSLPWTLQIGAKFLQVHPIGTISAILLALPGQIALIASFLLPIKIIMLMASEGIPQFMTNAFPTLDKKLLISLLTGLSIASFIFYHLTTKSIQSIAQAGVSRIEKRNQKLHLFEGQEELSRNAYSRYIDIITSINFIALGTIILFLIYTEVATAFLVYVIFCSFAAIAIKKRKLYDVNKFRLLAQKIIPSLINTGFFLLFLCIILDYIFFSIPDGFLTLLASIILARQVLAQTGSATNNLFFFWQKKQKLNAILFHKTPFSPPKAEKNSLLDFLAPSTTYYRQLQISIKGISSFTSSNAKLTWRDSGIPGIGFILASNPETDKVLLVKIYGKNKTTEARHEAALLLDPPETLPCPSLLTCTIIAGYFIHIFDLTGYSFPPRSPKKNHGDSLIAEISKLTIPESLMSRYTRSHNMLWNKIEEIPFHRWVTALTAHQAKAIQEFVLILPRIQGELKRLPLRLYNPQYRNDQLHTISPEGKTELLHWGNWSVEPLGVGLPLIHEGGTYESLHRKHTQQYCLTISANPMTAALVHKLLKQSQQQLLEASLKTIRTLLNRL